MGVYFCRNVVIRHRYASHFCQLTSAVLDFTWSDPETYEWQLDISLLKACKGTLSTSCRFLCSVKIEGNLGRRNSGRESQEINDHSRRGGEEGSEEVFRQTDRLLELQWSWIVPIINGLEQTMMEKRLLCIISETPFMGVCRNFGVRVRRGAHRNTDLCSRIVS